MAIFTKTNQSILQTGTVAFEGIQDMGGQRVRNAGEEQDSNDYVIKKSLDDHGHTQYVPLPHTDPVVENHTHPQLISKTLI
jgi:hypothetical protein